MHLFALSAVTLTGFCCLFPEEALYWIGKIRTFLAAVELRYLHLVREAAYQDERDRQELAHVSRQLSAIRRHLQRLPTTAPHAKKRRLVERQLAAVAQRLKAAQQKNEG